MGISRLLDFFCAVISMFCNGITTLNKFVVMYFVVLFRQNASRFIERVRNSEFENLRSRTPESSTLPIPIYILLELILDEVFADARHFRQPQPNWNAEGACFRLSPRHYILRKTQRHQTRECTMSPIADSLRSFSQQGKRVSANDSKPGSLGPTLGRLLQIGIRTVYFSFSY